MRTSNDIQDDMRRVRSQIQQLLEEEKAYDKELATSRKIEAKQSLLQAIPEIGVELADAAWDVAAVASYGYHNPYTGGRSPYLSSRRLRISHGGHSLYASLNEHSQDKWSLSYSLGNYGNHNKNSLLSGDSDAVLLLAQEEISAKLLQVKKKITKELAKLDLL